MKRPMMLPFNFFYLCTDMQAVADISEGIDVLLEMPLKPYVDKILKSLTAERSVEQEAELVSLVEANSEEGILLVPMRVSKEGEVLYTQAYRPKSQYSKISNTWWLWRNYTLGRVPPPTEDMRVYSSRVGLIIKGQRKGTPCSICPKVLDSLGSDPKCTFGLKECKENLNLKEYLNG
jgi:hypothetical protein